jgi:hypothetical protein
VAEPRIRRVRSHRQMYRVLGEYSAERYRLRWQTENSILVVRNDATKIGHVWVAISTGWWTLGLGNLVYHRAKESDRILITLGTGYDDLPPVPTSIWSRLTPLQRIGACVAAAMLVIGLVDFSFLVLGGVITGAVLGAIVAGLTKKITAIPLLGSAGAMVGFLLHVLFRLAILI